MSQDQQEEVCMYCGTRRPNEIYDPCCGEMHFEWVDIEPPGDEYEEAKLRDAGLI